MSVRLRIIVAFVLAASASAQEVRDVRIRIESIGLRGKIRPERWVPIRVGVQGQGPRDAKLLVEVVERDFDGDRVHYALPTFLESLRTRPAELYFRPRKPREGNYALTVLVRDEQTRDVLAQERFDLPVRSGSEADGAVVSGELHALHPARTFVGFLGTGSQATARSPTTTSLSALLNLYRRPTEDGSVSVMEDAARARWVTTDLGFDDLPALALGLESLDVLVWAPAGTENVDPARQQMLADWVAGGGRLIVFVGENFKVVRQAFPAKPVPGAGRARSPAPAGLLPVTIEAERPEGVTDELVRAAIQSFAATPGGDIPGTAPLRWAPFSARQAAASPPFTSIRTLLEVPADGLRPAQPLIVDSRFGTGSITAVAFNPAETPLSRSDWAGAGPLWRNLLHGTGLVPQVRELHPHQWEGGAHHADRRVIAESSLDRALEDFGLPSAGPMSVLLLLILYAGLVGPGSWFALRAMGLLRWGWPVFAVLVLGAGLLAYTTVSFLRGVTTRRTSVTVLDICAEDGSASAWHFEGVYSPLDGEFRLRPPTDEGWTAPWVWTDPGESADSTPAADRYFQSFDPAGRPQTELTGVPIRNHVKKFLARTPSTPGQGRFAVRKLHATVEQPNWIKELTHTFRSGRVEAGNDADGKPMLPVQLRRQIVNLEWDFTNNLRGDLSECILVIWPRHEQGRFQQVIDHRPTPDNTGTAEIPPGTLAPRRTVTGSVDFDGTAGAVVLELGSLKQSEASAGAAAYPSGRKSAPRLVPLAEWLHDNTRNMPSVENQLGTSVGTGIEQAAHAVRLLSLQRRLAFDPALPSGMASTTLGQGPFGTRAAASLAVDNGSLAYLDATASMRPDEALLVAVLNGDTGIAPINLRSAAGGEIATPQKSIVVVRIRLPFTLEVARPGVRR